MSMWVACWDRRVDRRTRSIRATIRMLEAHEDSKMTLRDYGTDEDGKNRGKILNTICIRHHSRCTNTD